MSIIDAKKASRCWLCDDRAYDIWRVKKFIALVEELNRLLDEKEKRLKGKETEYMKRTCTSGEAQARLFYRFGVCRLLLSSVVGCHRVLCSCCLFSRFYAFPKGDQPSGVSRKPEPRLPKVSGLNPSLADPVKRDQMPTLRCNR